MEIGILFDLDGTLLDTLQDLTDSTNHALARFGYPARTREQIRCFVGNGAARLIRLAVPEGADPELVRNPNRKPAKIRVPSTRKNAHRKISV